MRSGEVGITFAIAIGVTVVRVIESIGRALAGRATEPPVSAEPGPSGPALDAAPRRARKTAPTARLRSLS